MERKRAVFSWKGRPCVVTGERRENIYGRGGRHRIGSYIAVTLDFIDGQEPTKGLVGKQSFAKAKQLRGAELMTWQRAAELIEEGMDAARARRQAMDELAKGVLATGQALRSGGMVF